MIRVSLYCLLAFCIAYWPGFTPAAQAQCISAFPYHETFETSNGNWTSGGVANDWAWGTPTKATISGAGQGVKCWISGGLSNAAYSNGERSYVQSPCFDFTNLTHPYIQFKIFWESEHHYDGSNLQYSLNNGSTWINVGAINDPVDCYNQNWYNYSPINYLTTLATVKDGWSGNMQSTSGACQGGFGSNGWVLAKHCLTALAGMPNVIFRFTFGAGTSCNAFDGVAFDDILIQNAPRYTANFGYLCTTSKTFNFTDSSTNCPSSWIWNFGDAASGAANSSTLQNPTHIFSGAGVYQVQLVAINACSGRDTITKTIAVLGLSKDSSNVSCPGGNNGLATVVVSGNTAAVNYSWSTTPIQTNDTIMNLTAGTYTVTVTQAGTCAATANFHIQQPPLFAHSYTTTSAVCTASNGSITTTFNGGTPTYTYQWSPNVSSAATAGNLAAGTYTILITDQHNCVDSMQAVVYTNPGNLSVSSSKLNVSCFGYADGSATINCTGGTPAYTYVWVPAVSSSNTASNLSPTTYQVTVTDANNCVKQISFSITQPADLSLTKQVQPTTCGLINGTIAILPNGGTHPYTYSWSPAISTSNQAANLSAGVYITTVTDSNLCSKKDTNTIAASTALQISTTNTLDTCNKSSGTATAQIISGTGPYTYLWSISGSQQSYIWHLPGGTQYTVFVTDAANCIDSASVQINSIGMFQYSLGNELAICPGSSTAQLTVPSFYSVVWQDGSTTNTYSIKEIGTYSAIISNSYGCEVYDTVHVREHCEDLLLMPNSFTPNGDGLDDVYGAIAAYPEDLIYFRMKIYNRWGQELISTTAYSMQWDGTYQSVEQPLGVYVYMVEYQYAKETTKRILKGDITLIR